MLGLVDNTLARIEPVLDIQGGFSVRATKPSIKGNGELIVSVGGQRVESGVAFYVMKGEADINPRTGAFRVKPKHTATLRAIFAGRHEDVEVKG